MPNQIVEHLDPVGKTDYLSLQHIERYRFACTQLKAGQRVLDIAAGVGYGTEMLLKRNCEVIGADYSFQTLRAAQSPRNTMSLVTADALRLPFQSESFDVVVSFETIEHVHDGNRFLSEMYRSLQSGGIFICSTPNVHYTTHPPYHLKEYKSGEFYELVEQRFSQVERYAQYFRTLDRAIDLCRRQIGAWLGPLLEKTGAKALLKRALQRNVLARDGSLNMQAIPEEEGVEQDLPLQGELDSIYRVRPFTDSKYGRGRLLRIMIAVARKENGE